CAEDRFDQEGIAFGGDAPFEQASKRAPRVAAEAARRVVRTQPGDEADVVVCEAAERASSERPVLYAPAHAVARAYDHVRREARGDERRYRARVVREVSIQLHEPRVAALERVSVAVNEAAPVAARARAPEHREVRVRAEQFFGERGSPVRRVV